MQETNQAVMSRAAIPVPKNQKEFEANLKIGQYRHDVESYVKDPLTFLSYPVFDTFQDDRKLVGVISTSLYWGLIFRKILQPSSEGIICVLENSFNQTFSYRIDGLDVTYLGLEDAHDKQYDHLEFSADVNSYLDSVATTETRSYTTVSLNRDYGKYRLHVYPSKATEASYMSNEPAILSAVVACAFLFTSIVFLVFAVVVERRQHIVVTEAMMHARKAAETERQLNEYDE